MRTTIAFYWDLRKPIYAGANGSLRVSFGNVQGYSPQDGLSAAPFTSLSGLAAKYIPEDDEFDLPENLLSAITKRQRESARRDVSLAVPVNFLATLDSTGGNSGSPAINDKAQLVGLLFDGVYESIIGDWDYDRRLNRSIQVDTRYMLWVMEHVDGADSLLAEMDVMR